MAEALQILKRILKGMAPPGSRRRAAVRSLRRLAGLTPPEGGASPTPPKGMEDPYNLRALNRVLWLMERPVLRVGRRPRPGEVGAARWVMAVLMRRGDVRRRHVRPLRDGPDGGFCRELCAALGERSAAADDVRAAFARGLEMRPRQRYHVIPDCRHDCPLGLTPAGRAELLIYLLARAGDHSPLSDEEILWFHLHNAEDPHCGLVDTYLLTPSWQEHFPDGLTRSGWDGLRSWVRQEYGITRDWLDGLPVPLVHDEVEASCLRRIAQSLPAAPADGEAPLGANVIAHFRYPSGLMEAALNTVRGLERVGVRRSCRDLPNGVHDGVAADRSDCLGLEPDHVTLLHMAPEPLVEICYPLAGLWRRPGVYRVAVWYWELEAVPPEWARHAALLDEVWAPTQFIHDALRRVMPIPVTPMLPGMLPPVAPELPRAYFGLDPSKFLFLFMFDMNSVFERKNPLAVVSAFSKAFGGSAEVQLAVKVSRGANDPDNLARLRQACEEAGCVLIDRVLSREESYGLMNACDCYVSLHRSEGFGLTMAEAMFLGKPVVATAYSGNLDFMSADNSLLVPYEKTPLPRDYMVYRKGCVWAEPSVAAAVEAMRRVAGRPAEARAMGERARQDVAAKLSLEAYGRRMRERLAGLRRPAILGLKAG